MQNMEVNDLQAKNRCPTAPLRQEQSVTKKFYTFVATLIIELISEKFENK